MHRFFVTKFNCSPPLPLWYPTYASSPAFFPYGGVNNLREGTKKLSLFFTNPCIQWFQKSVRMIQENCVRIHLWLLSNLKKQQLGYIIKQCSHLNANSSSAYSKKELWENSTAQGVSVSHEWTLTWWTNWWNEREIKIHLYFKFRRKPFLSKILKQFVFVRFKYQSSY